jgi:hypothetical protein
MAVKSAALGCDNLYRLALNSLSDAVDFRQELL